ncbi:MAG: toll/interleukin-1 receptor domain-containing protein, partial [Gammaproteobacteria bacterium]
MPDPGIIDLSSIKCDKISSIFMQDSNYAFKETTDILRPEGLRRSSIVEIAGTHNKNDITKVKLIATQTELTNFLKIINKTFTENQTLHPKIENNPQVFISYAWEPVGASRTRQQNHLKQLAKDLYTLGFIAWLDLERMIGNIDQQMEGNIESSRYVLIIGTPLYTQRAGLETNVQKEFLAIIKKKEIQKDQITIFPVRFLSKGLTADEHQEYESFPFQLTSNDDYDNLLDFRDIDNGEEYVKQLISPYNPIGLIPRLLRLNKSDNIAKFSVHTKYDNASKFSEYTKYYNAFINQLKLLPASHLLADKGQEDAQAYDIDRRLEIYIEPYGVKINPTQTTEI